MANRRYPFRVRALRLMEVFVDVEAVTAEEAESEAAKYPGVKTVFAKSAIRTDIEAMKPRPQGVEGAEDERTAFEQRYDDEPR